MDGRLLTIWIKRVRRGPMDEVDGAELVTGEGLAGNANLGGRRQVTVLSREAWERAEQDLGRSADPAARRANLFVEGVDLEASRGRVLQVGATRIGLIGETRPCPNMDEAEPGLMKALDPEWRGGAYGVVLAGGRVEPGDAVSWADEVDFDPTSWERPRPASAPAG